MRHRWLTLRIHGGQEEEITRFDERLMQLRNDLIRHNSFFEAFRKPAAVEC
jgi:hypothetical protein